MMSIAIRKKKMSDATKATIIGAMVRSIKEDRMWGINDAQNDLLTDGTLCDVISQCGIDSEYLARACFYETGGGGAINNNIIDEIDRTASARFGDEYGIAFVERLAQINEKFRASRMASCG